MDVLLLKEVGLVRFFAVSGAVAANGIVDGMLFRSLLDAAASRGWTDLLRTLRLAEPSRPRDWKFHHLLLEKECGAKPSCGISMSPSDGPLIRVSLADATDLGIVLRGLHQSLGSSAKTKLQGNDRPSVAAKARLAEILASNPVILVARMQDEVTGVAYANFKQALDFDTRVAAVIHDAYTFPRFRGLGVSQKLVWEMEALALQSGHQVMIGTVLAETEEEARRIALDLSDFGWSSRAVVCSWTLPP